MKRFISGFLFGALLFAVPAIANNSKTVEAFYNNIKLSVYGQIVDTEGNEPFIVGGRTYVPARYVAEAMGGVVKWNETENTVEVTRQTPETTATPEPTKLTSDGVEAVYFNGSKYTPAGYYIPYTTISTRYRNILCDERVDGQTIMMFWVKSAPNNKISVFIYDVNVRISIPYSEYEEKLLPLLS